MIILGINAYHPDSSACLLIDGKVKFAIEEERIRRIKHFSGLPIESIKACLKNTNIKFSQIDCIAINTSSYKNFLEKIKFLLTNLNFYLLYKKIFEKKKKKLFFKSLTQEFGEANLGVKIVNVEHHLSHVASAFYESPFNDSINLSMDAFGDFVSTSWGVGNANKVFIDDKIFFPHSMGIFYEAFTQFMGFKNFGDEYKIMGLAAYGKPTEKNIVNKVVSTTSNGKFQLNLDFFVHHREDIAENWFDGNPKTKQLFSKKILSIFNDYREFQTNKEKPSELSEAQKNLASSIQSVYEDIFFNILDHLSKKYKNPNLTFSGGCAQNSLANGKILKNSNFKSLFIPSNPGDGGGSLGAAYYAYYSLFEKSISQKKTSAFLGPNYNNDEIANTIKNYKGIFDKNNYKYKFYDNFDNLCEDVAKEISKDKVVGWFQGRTEWGPRALGNRSIICDPRNKKIKELLNIKIKKRENFRPFAPSIIYEETKNWFEGFDDYEPYMSRVEFIKKNKIELIPGVAHIDGTGRVQTVMQKDNKKFYTLLKSFQKITGIPILLNTSFNENEPIVNTPADAINCFLRTKMDILVLGNMTIFRN